MRNDSKPKLSHKKWRALCKKLRRKFKRQKIARERDQLEKRVIDPQEETWRQKQDDYEEEQKLRRHEERRNLEHAKWLMREQQAQIDWQAKKEREALAKIRKEEFEKQRAEQEAKRKLQLEKEEKEAEAKKKKNEEKKKEKAALLKQALNNENKDDAPWHNPIAPVNYSNATKEECPFFKKTAACRFGDRCSRVHAIPDVSNTLLFPGMYSSFELEQVLHDEYDMDIDLEYEDHERMKKFEDFYNDVLPEFKKCGRVVQFKVSRNYEPHLRGNVYVQFETNEQAMEAFTQFNARWYGGRILSCQVVSIRSWKAAICGMYFKKLCPKGKNCNFLHVFKNPNNEFRAADFDYQNMEHSFRRRSRSPSRSSRYNRSRSRDRYSRKRSRTRSPTKRRDNRREKYRRRSRSRSPSRRRSRTRSPSWRRPRSRSPSRRSRSPSKRKGSRSPSRRRYSRSPSRRRRSRSRDRHSSHYRSRSRSRTPSYRRKRRSNSRSPTRQNGSRSKTKTVKNNNEKEAISFLDNIISDLKGESKDKNNDT